MTTKKKSALAIPSDMRGNPFMDGRRNLPIFESSRSDNSCGALAGTVAKEAYEAHVAIDALNRAGHCPQLKGHVFGNYV